MFEKRTKFGVVFGLIVFLSQNICAFDEFEIRDIRINGLQRISAGTVFNYLPIAVGDMLDSESSSKAIRTLYKTGFFKDVRLAREDDILIVTVVERSSVASIKITGNEDLETEELLKALKDIGLAEGRVFNRSLLDKIEQELRRQYFNQGKYSVQISSEIKPLERNRVDIAITIHEGNVAKIRQINVVGNNVFSDDELLDIFELSTPTLISFYTQTDQYSKQKLAADLESLSSYYLDRGYINFKINSTQVSITPNKRDIYLTVNLSEGEQFTVSEVKLAGELILPKQHMFHAVKVREGAVFSQKEVTFTTKTISDKLGDIGYAFANVNMIPEVDMENHSVSVTFFIDPGRRVYVRRINMIGNTKTRDEVLRREMRQMESAWMSTNKVERSRERLDRLGYFEEVKVETPSVPGTPDQVDVNFTVEEKPSGNLLAGIGYSQSQGFLVNASVTQENFLGSGKQVSFSFNNSEVNTTYQLAYTNPYYTIDGISRGFSTSYNKTDAGEANISNYSTDIFSAGVVYSFPINEFDRFFLSFDYENLDVNIGSSTSRQITRFISDVGSNFDSVKISGGWSHDTRNRAIFATKGGLQRVSTTVAVPGGDLNYYKLVYRHIKYLQLTKKLTLRLNGEFGYGNGFAKTNDLPFFENFFVGGSRSIRGYEDNTLGPKDSNGDPLGGNVRYLGNAEIIIPVPFFKDAKSVRISGFLDGGNVFDNNVDVDEFRYSLGIAAKWLSPVGALTFSLGKPLNARSNDDEQVFQFSFGSTL